MSEAPASNRNSMIQITEHTLLSRKSELSTTKACGKKLKSTYTRSKVGGATGVP